VGRGVHVPRPRRCNAAARRRRACQCERRNHAMRPRIVIETQNTMYRNVSFAKKFRGSFASVPKFHRAGIGSKAAHCQLDSGAEQLDTCVNERHVLRAGQTISVSVDGHFQTDHLKPASICDGPLRRHAERSRLGFERRPQREHLVERGPAACRPSEGDTAIAPIDPVGRSSKIGVHVRPKSVVSRRRRSPRPCRTRSAGRARR